MDCTQPAPNWSHGERALCALGAEKPSARNRPRRDCSRLKARPTRTSTPPG
ncbi:hypothetical protein RR42_s1387 [Cupriavidus basilensis]|uniref:Uncharacterized protein n=1 Tax=Cupriavidus basilensis TaxID=68895 RepID=A0A0C4YK70_9BURK|nr:hypothetical protein RR42_s1387 [Cupriavidus basilensis]